jgi:hypothetical protein
MYKSFLTLAAAIALMAGAALAQSDTKPAARDPWAGQANTSLTDAIAVVEHATNGKILEIRFLHGPGKGYEAVVAKKDAIINVRENPLTSDVTVIEAEAVPVWMADWKLRQDVKSIEKAKVPLADGVRTAENSARAPAIDAGIAKPLSADNAVLAYNVEVDKNGKPVRVVVDATTGQIIADPEPLLVSWTPEELFEKTAQTLHQ